MQTSPDTSIIVRSKLSLGPRSGGPMLRVPVPTPAKGWIRAALLVLGVFPCPSVAQNPAVPRATVAPLATDHRRAGGVGGNTVALDLGPGRYAYYVHLKPGSVRVKTGERVRRGQVLGLVGNS